MSPPDKSMTTWPLAAAAAPPCLPVLDRFAVFFPYQHLIRTAETGKEGRKEEGAEGCARIVLHSSPPLP